MIGRTLQLSNQTVEVIGVMPEDFVFPYGGMLGPGGFTRVTRIDLWMPIAFSGPRAEATRMRTSSGQLTRNTHWWGAIGRLKPGITAERAEVELQTIAAQLEQQYPDSNKGWSATVVPTLDQTVGTIRPALLILMVGIACVLLMAAVNVANLLLARAISRERELATRAALGAARARLVRQLLTESVILSTVGGLAGLGVMWAVVRGLVSVAPAHLPRIDEVSVDWRVLLVTGVVTMLTGVLVGLAPALSSSSINPQAALQDHSRGTVGGAARRRVRSALVVAEVALAVALTTGAGLLLRSFVSLLNVNPGFVTEQLLTWQMNIPDRLQSPDDRRAFYRDFFARMEALPGVQAVGGTTRIPLGSTSVSTSIQVDGRAVPVAELPEVQFRRAMHDYFATMGIPSSGAAGSRQRTARRRRRLPSINETMARRMFPGEEAIGQRVRIGSSPTGPWTTIVGVIGDVRHGGLEETPQPELYITSLQNPPVAPFIVLRVSGDPAAIAETVRAEARAIDKDLPVYDMRTMATLAVRVCGRAALHPAHRRRLRCAGPGARGHRRLRRDVAHRQRAHREVAVRVALGAAPARMVGLIVRQATTLAALGVAIGVAVVLPLTPLLQSQLYGVTAADPVTLISVPVGLLWSPHWRHSCLRAGPRLADPLVALRAE